MEENMMTAEDRLKEFADRFMTDKEEMIRQELLPIAVADGDHGTVRHLLQKGTSTEARFDGKDSEIRFHGKTSLNIASMNGDLELVKLLVESGANIKGGSSVDAAASNGHAEVVAYLVQAGAGTKTSMYHKCGDYHSSALVLLGINAVTVAATHRRAACEALLRLLRRLAPRNDIPLTCHCERSEAISISRNTRPYLRLEVLSNCLRGRPCRRG